jgi:hypothetical protein
LIEQQQEEKTNFNKSQILFIFNWIKIKKCWLTVNAPNENVSSIGWNSPNEYVSCSWNQIIKLWNMDTLQSTQIFLYFYLNVCLFLIKY